MSAFASTRVVGAHRPGFDARVNGTADTTAEPRYEGAHVDDRVDRSASSPSGALGSVVQSQAAGRGSVATSESPAVRNGTVSETLTPAERASLALLRHIGGEGYVGDRDDIGSNTISRASAGALHAHGLIDVRYRRGGDVVSLVEEAR